MAAKYWLQAGTGTWSTVTTPWRTTDGGSTLTSAPTTSDDVYFSSCNAGTVTLSGTLNCRSLNITTGSAMTFTGTGAINCLGDITVPSNITWNGTGTFTSTGTSITHAISFTPATGGPSLTCSGTGSVHNFNAAYTTRVATSFVQLSSGTLNLNDWNITCGFFSSDASASRTINFGDSGGIYLVDTTAARTVVNFATATLLSCTGAGGFYTNMSTTRTFSLGTTVLGATYNLSPANITLYAGASIATFTTNGYVRKLDLSSYTGNPATTTLNICGDLSLGSGTYTGLSPTFRGPLGSLTFNTNSKTISSVNVILTVIETVLYINGTFTCTTMSTTSGTVDFQNNNVTATSSMTYTGTAVNAYWSQTATVTAPTFNLSSTPYFNFDQGTLNVTSMAHSTGTFRLGGGTFNLGNGTSTGSYTFSAGLIDLNDQVLTVPNTFSSSNSGVRSIYIGDYSSGYIIVRNLSAATITNFTWTGGAIGTFAIKPTATSVTPSVQWGSTGSTAANRANISFDTLDVALGTSWCNGNFESMNFGTIAVTVGSAALCNCKYLTLSATGNFTAFSATIAFADGSFSGDNPMGTLTLAAGAGNNVTMSGVCRVTNWTTTSGNLLSSGDPYGYDSIIVTGTWTWSSSSFVIAQVMWESCPNITCLNFTLSNATWSPSWPTSFVTTGTITLSTNGILGHNETYNGWGSCATLTQSGAGSVANLGNYYTGSFTVTGVYTLTAGTLNMQGYDLYIGGSLSASSSSTRAINFSGANIYITSTTSSTGLTAATLTLLSTDQTGTIQVNAATIRKSLTWGSTAGGSTSNAVSVVMYGGGVLNPTITTGSWFEVLDLQGLEGSNNQQSGITINITEGLILPPSGATPRPTDYAFFTVVFQGPTLASAITGYLNCNDRISTTGTIGVLTFAMTGTVRIDTEVTVGSLGAATGITTLTSGTLDINGQALNTNTFVSATANTRALAYNGGSIYVNSTTANPSLNLSNATNFTITPGQTGAFVVPMNISKTFSSGTTGGSVNFAPNVTLTPETALAITPVPTLTTGGWFGVLDISASSATIATTSLNVTSLNLGSGDYSNMTITVFGDGYISGVDNKEIGAITIGNGSTITTTMYQSFRMNGALIIANGSTLNVNGQSLTPASVSMIGNMLLGGATVAAGTAFTQVLGNLELGGGTLSTVTYTLTAGAISLGGGNLNVQTFSSSSASARSITGTGTVNCAGNWTTTNGGTFTKGSVDSYTIKMLNSSAKTFAGGGGAFGTLVQAGAGALTVTGSNSFGDVQQTLVAPAAAGQGLFDTVGWSYWTVPAGVYSISAVAVGGGGGTFWAETTGAPFSGISGGGGGGLAYANSMSVFPGQILVVYVGGGGYARAGGPPSPLPSVGIAGGPSYIGSSGAAWIRGGGGGGGIGNSTTSNPGGTGGTSTGTLRAGGGTGGAGGAVNADTMPGAGGGGAGGYSGNGGAAGTVTAPAGVAGAAGAASSGAAGAGGSGGAAAIGGAAGGGVNVYGIGTTGAAGPIQTLVAQQGGYGGSSGGDGSGTTAGGDNGGYGGGGYGGGGGGGADDSGPWCGGAAYAAQGAIRVIWGDARSFPSNAPDV